MRTVQLLFRLPRKSTPRPLRQRVEFLKLACLHLGLRTVYYRATSEAYNRWRWSWFLSRKPRPSVFALQVGR